MTTRFLNEIIPWVFKWEGTTYENDPDDPGGATKFGIDQRSHKDVDIKNLTANQATKIYWDEYWVKNHCQEYHQPLDWIYFNACVNCGRKRAQRLLRASGANPKKFLDEQDAFYKRLALARMASAKYLKGWLARTQDLRKVTGLA